MESHNAASLRSAVWFVGKPETIQKRGCGKLARLVTQVGLSPSIAYGHSFVLDVEACQLSRIDPISRSQFP